MKRRQGYPVARIKELLARGWANSRIAKTVGITGGQLAGFLFRNPEIRKLKTRRGASGPKPTVSIFTRVTRVEAPPLDLEKHDRQVEAAKRSPAERYIIDNWGKLTPKTIGQALRISESRVLEIAKKLGLIKDVQTIKISRADAERNPSRTATRTTPTKSIQTQERGDTKTNLTTAAASRQFLRTAEDG